MRCCKKAAEFLVALALLLASALVPAAEIDIRNPQLALDEEQYRLSADFSIEFNPRLEEAVGRGLALYFVADFELTRPRWYWFDDKVAKFSQTWRLTYHALTRQYRLSTGALNQSYSSLDEALSALAHLRHWPVVERDRLRPGESLDAALRLRLDLSQLPKPFQLEALSNKDWALSSDWKRWTYTVPAAAPGAEGK
jgi:hypothetical protein